MTEFVHDQEDVEKDAVEIPIAHRLAHFGIDVGDVYPKVNAGNIATELGVDNTLILRFLRNHKIEGELMLHETQQEYFDYYPHYIIALIREERAWREWYLTLPKRVNTNQVAEAVGRSYGWTSKTLSELYPDTPQQRKGHRSRFYPRSAVRQLRDMTLATPPDENWPTIPRLVEFTGRDREWVLNRIAQTTIRPELRRQAVTGREFPHYPPDTFDVLREAMEERAKPAGDWLTAYAIAKILEKSYTWATKHLADGYREMGEPRLDDMGVERIHYPPSVLDLLRSEIEERKSYKEAGDWVTISTLEKQVGMHAVTLTRIMEKIDVESEMRLDLKGRPKLHFSPETKQRLVTKALELYNYPEADGWVTFTVAQKIIGRPAGWIREQFTERRVVSETRLDKSKHPVEHYDPDIVQEIKEYGDLLDAGSLLSIDDIIEKTKKSRTWVVARLGETTVQPVKRFSKFNRFIDHYPETIIETLLAGSDTK